MKVQHALVSVKPEYVSKGKEGVATRFHPLEEIELLKETKFYAWVAIMWNIITPWRNFSSSHTFLPLLTYSSSL